MLINDVELSTEITSDSWHSICQETINQFADATGDYQWIHIDNERCKRESPFKTTIAHGFLTVSLLPQAFAEQITIVPSEQTLLNYGIDRLRFLEPVRVDDQVRFRFKLANREVKTKGILHRFNVSVEIKGRELPAFTGEFLMLLIE